VKLYIEHVLWLIIAICPKMKVIAVINKRQETDLDWAYCLQNLHWKCLMRIVDERHNMQKLMHRWGIFKPAYHEAYGTTTTGNSRPKTSSESAAHFAVCPFDKQTQFHVSCEYNFYTNMKAEFYTSSENKQ